MSKLKMKILLVMTLLVVFAFNGMSVLAIEDEMKTNESIVKGEKVTEFEPDQFITIDLSQPSTLGANQQIELDSDGPISTAASTSSYLVTPPVSYYINVSVAGQYIINTTSYNCTIDTTLTVYNSLGQYVGYNDDYNGSLFSQVVAQLTVGQNRVDIGKYGGTSGQKCYMNITYVTPPPAPVKKSVFNSTTQTNIFTYYSDVGMAARWWNSDANVNYEYTVSGNNTTASYISATIMTKDPGYKDPTYQLWTVDAVKVRDVNIAGTTFTLPYNLSVIVPGGTIGDYKYSYPNKSASGSYNVSATGVIQLSNDCVPMVHIHTVNVLAQP